ncbi:MAG: hypothetical protein C5S41_01705 [Candidatus Methanomarinus sp.]|nr:MAG: hypothetical protein C5S41_01705 [ANME-2 cluster archaeon]
MKNIEDVVHSERERLKGDPNIIGFGYGVKRKKGEIVPGFSIIYVVKTKYKDVNEIKKIKSEIIPDKVEDYPTDVIEQRPARPQQPTGERGSRIENPLVGGTSTTVLSDWHSFPTGYGTLGGICFDNASDSSMALSNAHVWGTDTGRDVIQPWMPTGEYLEAVIKLLMCGPATSYILDTTIPSPLTAGLAAGAAAAWIAAAASDAEDPSRWGQRTGTVPPATARTEFEKVHISAELPNRPFAGRAYSTKTKWEYSRETTQGSFQKKITKTRKNEHVLLGKKVWTDREAYHGGERVTICAEVTTNRTHSPDDYFVVAHCFPKTNPERVIKRILTPGYCRYPQSEKETCFHGFMPPAEPGQKFKYPYDLNGFHFESQQSGGFAGPWPHDDPAAVTVMRIPSSSLQISFPASSEVRIEIFHTNRPVKAEAFDVFGNLICSTVSTEEQNIAQTLVLTGTDIIRVVLSGGGGEGNLVGICITHKDGKKPQNKNEKRFIYTGKIDLDMHEAKDKWGVSLFVQTVNNVPTGTEPAIAARTIGGITASDNIADMAVCGVIMLLDHVFDVI